ncbi:hypothetical protein GCM10027275_23720 [Rhabdobacter roseus]|uniref:UPF0323 domain-containing protein n=1 Tax=Rhabdobacter roseus TaxID=1655419 RepID=A0A840TRX7_9BACT|nr:hypothetical protein [Rhabdobacter roseus]MBB5284312.1 hypothetical protein [Rhabdobacter roseus]
MTPLRTGSFIRRVKDITISGTLAVAILASGIALPGCSGSEDEAHSYEETTYSKGIRSYIKEVEPGEFKITDEQSVPADQSAAIVTYLDGHVDTLSTTTAKALIDRDIRSDESSVGRHGGLSNVLLYGGMGYLLGRTMNHGYINSYRSAGESSRFYSNPNAYNRAQGAVQDVNTSRSTRVVSGRPAGGRSGFFGKRSSSSGG